MTTNNKKRLIIGISGASDALLGIDMLKMLRKYTNFETHVVISKGAELTIDQETNYSINDVINLSDEFYDIKNIGASIASGSFKTEGMIIIPCSMKTVAGIACGYSENLLLRAADVIIKERRKLIIAPRETPLSSIHLRNLLTLSDAGAMIFPPMITYYNNPKNIEDMHVHIIGKILEKFDIDLPNFKRWNGMNS